MRRGSGRTGGAETAARGRARRGVPLGARGLLGAAVVCCLALAAAPLGTDGLRPLATLDTTAGLAVFEASCAACHGFAGEGLVGAVPPLVADVPALLSLEGGREYLVRVLLNGLSGEIEVQGRRYSGVMPSWAHLSDQELADVLNHVATAWGNAALLPPDEVEFTALEVALARGFPADQASLAAQRRALARASEQ